MSGIENCVEIRVKGRWVAVPSLDVSGNKLYATGKWLRTAKVRSEEMMENELPSPELYIESLKANGNQLKADIFTFTQKLPATQPKYPYPAELESVAAIRLVNFKEWWGGSPAGNPKKCETVLKARRRSED